ncbi:hypothetical protein HQ545_02455 [Candidatus Woesearchaeota archaeon]|nr:hypothetical protein [Candidatus Woesearchaeota archaeon]
MSNSIISSIISDMKSTKLFSLIVSSFRSWYKNWPWILFSVFFDVLFIISTGIVITLVQFKLFESLEAVMRMAGEATGGIANFYNQTGQVTSGIAGLTSDSLFQYHVNTIFQYLGLMVLGVFICWIIFQGLSWYAAHRMSSKKRLPFIIYWKNFALQSFPFYLISVFLIFLSIRLIFSINTSIAPIVSEGFINFFFIILMIVNWYFGFLSFTLTSRSSWYNFKKSFAYSTKRFTKIIPSIAFILVLFLVIDLFLRLFKGDPVILGIVGTFTFMPTLVFSRILLFKTTKEYWEGKTESKKAKKKHSKAKN